MSYEIPNSSRSCPVKSSYKQNIKVLSCVNNIIHHGSQGRNNFTTLHTAQLIQIFSRQGVTSDLLELLAVTFTSTIWES
jgi:hypothetical protein